MTPMVVRHGDDEIMLIHPFCPDYPRTQGLGSCPRCIASSGRPRLNQSTNRFTAKVLAQSRLISSNYFHFNQPPSHSDSSMTWRSSAATRRGKLSSRADHRSMTPQSSKDQRTGLTANSSQKGNDWAIAKTSP